MNLMRKVGIFILILISTTICTLSVTRSDVFAECKDAGGNVVDCDGNGSTGTPVSCSTFNHAITVLCGTDGKKGDGSGGGGASWHIYKTDGDVAPSFDSNILTNDVSLSTIKSTCKAQGAEYYAAYGWEPNTLKYPTVSLYGPAAWNKGAIKNAIYNNYEGRGTFWGLNDIINNLEERKAILENFDSAPGDIKLGSGVAEFLRKEIGKATGRTIDDSVGAFCFKAEWFGQNYYGKSFIRTKTANNNEYGDTGVVGVGGNASVSLKTITIKQDENATITFSHNVYVKPYAKTGVYRVDREWPGGAYSVTGMATGSSQDSSSSVQEVKFDRNDVENGYYIGGPRNMTDGSNWMLSRDEYYITFTNVGTYRFCQMLYAGKDESSLKQLTKVCTTIVVGEGTPSGGEQALTGACDGIVDGLTTVTSRVYNQGNSMRPTLTGTYKGWQDEITYAMPTDKIAWIDCYNPGAQVYYDYTVSKFYKEPDLNTKNVTQADPQSGASKASGKGSSKTTSYYVKQNSYTTRYRCELAGYSWRNGACYQVKTTTGYSGAFSTEASSGFTDYFSKTDSPKGTSYSSSGETASGVSYWDGHGAEGVCYTTHNEEKTMQKAYSDMFGHTWTNRFYADTTSPYGFNNLNISNKRASQHFPENGSTFDGIIWKVYNNGTTVTSPVQHNYLVARVGDASKTYQDTIATNGWPIFTEWSNDGKGYHPWTCCSCSSCGCCCCGGEECSCCGCCCCTYSHDNLYYIGGAADAKNMVEDWSKVTIPYNYENFNQFDVDVTNPERKPEVYAGETIRVGNTQTNINKRWNSVVEASYTTQVDEASVRLIGFVSNTNSSDEYYYTSGDNKTNSCELIASMSPIQCSEEQRFDGTLNAGGDVYGHTDYMGWDGTYNVFDDVAGNYMCFVMAVYPATSGQNEDPGNNDADQSGGDRNTKAYGDKRWRVSARKCIVIAKKPSIQILGGDLFTSGGVSTIISTKQQLKGVDGYSGYERGFAIRDSVTVNGSWVEEGITALGKVTELASGAALGRNEDSRRFGGNNDALNFCKARTLLSFANYTSWFVDGICPNTEAIGYFAGNSGGITGKQTKNRQALASYWGVVGAAENGDFLTSDDEGNVDSATGKNIKVYAGMEDFSIYGGNLSSNTLRVIKASGTVTISGDIRYTGDVFTSSGDIPKAIIYGEIINIDCEVNQIDAILIAEKQINTCYNTEKDNVNSRNRSKKLTINGAAIANNVVLPRTYGNGIGIGSGEAAEIINYDTTVIPWGRYMAGTSESDTMTVTYMRELAPRY